MKIMKLVRTLSLTLCILSAWACQTSDHTATQAPFSFYPTLSQFQFFQGNINRLEPVDEVIAYELNSPLFTDYASKTRFFRLPPNTKMIYKGSGLPEFPEGTILIKNFFYQEGENLTQPNRRLVETRLLVKDQNTWKVGTYIWNDEQTEAYHEILGGTKKITWTNPEGETLVINYVIPDNNDCKSCHQNSGKISPIGPKIRNLNGENVFAGEKANQLVHYASLGKLEGLPEDFSQIDKLPVWDDDSYSLEERARAYLDINCGHCHSANGPANNTALNLNLEENDPHKLGFCKGPVSAAQGSGSLRFDIVPGNARTSILHYRMNSIETGVAMPEIGKTLIHKEGVALIEAWINSLNTGGCN